MKSQLGLAPRHSGPGSEVAARLPLDRGHDLIGLAYERFFPDLFKGRHGQYFTPAPIVRLLFARLPVTRGDRVVDPACGSGALLAEAAARGAEVQGIDVDPRLVELARLGLSLAGARAEVAHGDLFATAPTPVDVLVANPPFSVRIGDPDVLGRFEMARGRESVLSDQLFVEAMEGWVRPGGHAGVVLPWSVLVNPTFAEVRARIDAYWHRKAIVGLPEGVFRPFGGAAGRAVILVLERRGRRVSSVRPHWAEVVDPGYDVRRKHVRVTSGAEVNALVRGEGWQELPVAAWRPIPARLADRDVVTVGEVATPREVGTLDAPDWVVDLGDVVRSTGEVLPRRVDGAPGSRRLALHQGDVLVARMRPNLGNVAWLATLPERCGGSPEWIALTARRSPGYLWHALRTPTWRDGLPVTAGQTRPRTDVATVLASEVRWPGDAIADRVHGVSERLERRRAEARAKLAAVQEAVDAFAAGRIDATELDRRIASVDGDTGPAGR
ncbi:MAG: N-6 DNA methylase [Myxococcota bacterium]